MKLNKEKVFVYVSEQKGYTEGLLGTNKVNFYYRFDNNELFWKSDAEKDKEKWHGTYYDKDKGVTSADKLGEYEANEEKAEGVIKGPLQAYNALRHNPDRIGDLIKEGELLNEMGVKYEEVILPREFFILGPKGWAVSAWPYHGGVGSLAGDGKNMPKKCTEKNWQVCICLCKREKETFDAFGSSYVWNCDNKGLCENLPKRIFTQDLTRPFSPFIGLNIQDSVTSFKLVKEADKIILQKLKIK